MRLRSRLPLLVLLVAAAAGCDTPINPAPPSGTEPASAQSALTISNPGRWDAVPSWPALVASHMALLPDGRVFTFNSSDVPGTAESKEVFTWDPRTESWLQFANGSNNVFCSGHSFLPDGRLVVAGGHISDGRGIKAVNVFDFRTSAWSRGADLKAGRWYPTVTTLGNGELLVVAGTNEVGAQNSVPEVGSGASWRQLAGAFAELPYYPQMHLAPDGTVFMVGPARNARFLNPAGDGAWTTLAPSNWGLRTYSTSVTYAPGKILLVGGGDAPTSTAEVIDLNARTGWRYTGSMAYARRHLNGTVLPDGTVLVTGGTKGAGFNNESQSVLAAELWDPATEKWTLLASMKVGRTYHSTALLLPDGRVLSAGGGRCGSCTANHTDAEAFSPPYLFNADGTPAVRPAIAAAPAEVALGQAFSVRTPDAGAVARVTLVRISSVTHAFNQNQRFVELAFTADGAAGELHVTAPSSANVAPAGHYMLFVLNDRGVPSVAKVVRLVGTAPLPAPSSGGGDSASVWEVDAGPAQAGDEGQPLTFHGSSSREQHEGAPGEPGALTYSWNFGDGTPTVLGSTATHAYADNGRYTASLTVRDTTGESVSDTVAVVIANVAPVARAGNDTTVIAGRRLDQRGTFADAGTRDGSWRYTYAWGDGTSSHSGYDATQGALPVIAHTYKAAGTRTLKLSVRDKNGAVGTDERVVTVLPNHVPVAAANGPYAAPEGTRIAFSAAGTSDGNGDALTYKWTFGDGTTSTSSKPLKSYADDRSYVVTLVVKDPSGAADTATTSAVVSNATPTASLSAPSSISEGSSYTVSITGSDAGTADRSTLQYALDCGLGAGYGAWSATTRSVTCPVQPDERSAITVRGKVRDKDGAERAYSRSVSVVNATPVVSISPTTSLTLARGGTLGVLGTFTDAGAADGPWKYTVVWGDGSPNTTASASVQGAGVAFNHAYSAAGTYPVYLTVTDRDGRTGRSATLTVTVAP